MEINTGNTTNLAQVLAAVLASITTPTTQTRFGNPDPQGGNLYRDSIITYDRDGKPRFDAVPESLRHNPLKIRSTVRLNVLGDFVAYVNRFTGGNPPEYARHLAQKPTADGGMLGIPGEDPDRELDVEFNGLKQAAIIMIAPDLAGLKAQGQEVARCVLDFHGSPEYPQRGEHQAHYIARPSPEYLELIALDGQWHKQEEFSLLLKPLARYCNSMSAGELIELARTLQLSASSAAHQIVNHTSGSADIVYKKEVSATTGATQDQKVSVPNVIEFRCPMLLGGAPVHIVADFEYRLQPGGVVLRLRFAERAHMENQALNQVADEILYKTGIQTLVGTLDVGSK